MRRGVLSEQRVRAVGDRDRPLGVRAQREARHAERGRLLLDAAGVGDDRARADLQARGSRGSRAARCSARRRSRGRTAGPSPRAGARARVDGKTTGARRASAASAVDDARRSWSRSSTFDGRCSVTSTYSPSAHAEPLPRRRGRAPRGSKRRSESIIVLPTKCTALRIDAFGGEVRRGLGAVGEEQVREPVGEDAVDLLGHRPVAGAQAGLDVRHRHRRASAPPARTASVELTSPPTHDQVGASLEQDLARRPRAARAGLLAVRPRSDAEEDVRARGSSRSASISADIRAS